MLSNYYFVMYDMHDNLICYFETYRELLNELKILKKHLVEKFKKAKDFIVVVLNFKKYKIYKFEKR